jgi:hypothetical protein
VTQGQGPLNDPRLVERRGDLSGLNAALFVVLVIVAFLAAGYLLATYLHLGASPSPSPSALAPSSPLPTRSPASSPSVVPSPTRPGSTIPIVGIGEAADVTVNGIVAGTVTVISADYPESIAGQAAGVGQRWLVTRIRYTAVDGSLPYDAADWAVVDGAGERHPWAGTDLRPPLGSGTVKAGNRKSGNVTFKVPLSGDLSLVLRDADGVDVLSVTLP